MTHKNEIYNGVFLKHDYYELMDALDGEIGAYWNID